MSVVNYDELTDDDMLTVEEVFSEIARAVTTILEENNMATRSNIPEIEDLLHELVVYAKASSTE